MPLKKHDFVALDYVAKEKASGKIFDLTLLEVAQKEGLAHKGVTFEPVVVCLGEGHILLSLEEYLVGKEVGTSYFVELSAEKAFGKKDSKLIKLVSLSLFNKQNIKPYPGLQLNLDGMVATVKTVSGGRVILDFNHPLAGKEVSYEVTPRKIITETQEKLTALLAHFFGKKSSFTFKEGVLTLDITLPPEMQKVFTQKVTSLIAEVKSVQFKTSS